MSKGDWFFHGTLVGLILTVAYLDSPFVALQTAFIAVFAVWTPWYVAEFYTRIIRGGGNA